MGQGGQTLNEKREAEQERREQEKRRKEEEQKDALTFGQVFDGAYIEDADRTKDKRLMPAGTRAIPPLH